MKNFGKSSRLWCQNIWRESNEIGDKWIATEAAETIRHSIERIVDFIAVAVWLVLAILATGISWCVIVSYVLGRNFVRCVTKRQQEKEQTAEEH